MQVDNLFLGKLYLSMLQAFPYSVYPSTRKMHSPGKMTKEENTVQKLSEMAEGQFHHSELDNPI